MDEKVESVLVGKHCLNFEYIQRPGAFEQMTEIAESFVNTLRDSKLTYNESKLTLAFAQQLLEYCILGESVF